MIRFFSSFLDESKSHPGKISNCFAPAPQNSQIKKWLIKHLRLTWVKPLGSLSLNSHASSKHHMKQPSMRYKLGLSSEGLYSWDITLQTLGKSRKVCVCLYTHTHTYIYTPV